MAAVVDVWVVELAKLGEKVKMRKSLLLKLKRTTDSWKAPQEEHTNFKVKADNDTTTLSESTLFMLMDSFAPS